MEVKRIATAGTLESSDVLVKIEPLEDIGLIIEIESIVEKQFGEIIRDVINKELKKLNLTNAKITIIDKGALDCTLQARVQTAVERACKE